MKLFLIGVFLFITIVGCEPDPKYSSPDSDTTVSEPAKTPPVVMGEEPEVSLPTPVGPEYPVRDVKKVFTVKIEDTNYSKAQKSNLEKAERLIERIFNSEEYKQAVLGRKKFSSNLGLSNVQIYEKLFAGAEALVPAINYQMDLKVEMYHARFSRVVGYTTPDVMVVYTNSKFHDNYSPCEIASNLTHEWTHKMGFDHASASDDNSVPYSHNEIVEALCEKFQ